MNAKNQIKLTDLEYNADELFTNSGLVFNLGCLFYDLASKNGNNLANYSQELRNLFQDVLHTNPQRRPSIDQILSLKFILPYYEKSAKIITNFKTNNDPEFEYLKGKAFFCFNKFHS